MTKQGAVLAARVGTRNFATWDADGDGYLVRAELEEVVMDPSVRGPEAAAAVALRASLDTVEDLGDDQWFFEDGLSRNDLSLLEQRGLRFPQGAEAREVGWHHARATDKIEGRPAGLGTPSGPESIRQGSIGNCTFHAALGALLAQDASALDGVLEARADGAYRVNFPGRPPIIIPSLTDGERGIYGASPGGTWLAVLEKAFGMERGTAPVPGEAGASTPTAEALRLLTGRSARTERLEDLDDAALDARLESAFIEGRPVVAATDPSFLRKRLHGIVMNHAYSVLAVDAEHREVRLRNPWGHQEHALGPGETTRPDDLDDGIFVLSYAEFRAHFQQLSYVAPSNEGADSD